MSSSRILGQELAEKKNTSTSRDTSETMLDIANVGFSYSRGSKILENISLQIGSGVIYGLLGPNGAGKSTLIKVLLGLERHSRGKVLWFGHPLNGESRQRLGYVPQELALISDLTALDNVKIFGKLYGLRGKTLELGVHDALNFVGLWNERKKKPTKYSGGMKRRLNIACTLVHRPQVIIMDEPTVGVDPQSRNFILDAIEDLRNQGRTIIYISHYMEEVARLCTQIGVMDGGKLLCEGTLAELLATYAPEAVVRLEIPSGTKISDQRLENFVVVSKTEKYITLSLSGGELEAIAAVADSLRDVVTGFTYIPPNLEQVFFRLTQKRLRD